MWPFVLAFAVLVPLLLTLAGRLSSPPEAIGPPVGHIVYMEADEPSEHTSLLRGMRLLAPDGSERELVHETEPQDVDAGQRTWINQPCASPDGKWVAFEQQNITIGEEKQSVGYQLWVLPLREPGPPRLLLDITKAKLKPFVGLAWTPDSKSVVFLNDANALYVDVRTGTLTRHLLPSNPPVSPPLIIAPPHNPTVLVSGRVFYSNLKQGIITVRSDGVAAAADLGAYLEGVKPNDYKPYKDAHSILFGSIHGNPAGQTAQWGWSVWGGRKITNLHWSPDGKYVAYSVSKPPFEDELFYIDVATGKCRQLPVRTGPAAWDWTP